MRADRWAFPDFQVCTNSSMPSPGERTSSVTVFIVPPRYVALKIGDQLLGRGEGIVTFLTAKVPMIAFACLIVEPQNALTVYNVSEPVLEPVIRSGKGFRHSPENQLGEGAFRVNNSSTEKLHGLHVGDYANIWPVLSMDTTRTGSCNGAELISLLRVAGAFLSHLIWRRRKGLQMFLKYAGMTMEERDPYVAEWATTIRIEESPTASAPKT
ncbi:MAG TPA: hypothetical protein VJ760_01470 [Nitrospiraceae bacterium]|nr:hypothetical protein [Nitrospiraceae bacterium]